jgi:hypothetical protein
MTHIIKKIGIVLSIPFLLLFILSILLYLPALQNKAREVAVRYASEATGMEVSVEHIRLSFPFDLTISGVEVANSSQDTLLSVGDLTVRIKLLPLLHSNVELDELTLRDATVDSDTLLTGMQLQGAIGKLYVQAKSIHLSKEVAEINQISLDNSSLKLTIDSTSTTTDTTTTPLLWKILIDKASINELQAQIKLPGDTLFWNSEITNATLLSGSVDLGEMRYAANQFELKDAALDYGALLQITKFNLLADSLQNQGINTQAILRSLSLHEGRGWNVNKLHGVVKIDSTQIRVDDLELLTPYSSVRLAVKGTLDALEQGKGGVIDASLHASIGKEDLRPLLSDSMQVIFNETFPAAPLTLQTTVSGNVDRLRLVAADAGLAEAFQVNLSGEVRHGLDSIKRAGELQLGGKMEDLGFVLAMLGDSMQTKYTIPQGMELVGKAQVAQGDYKTELSLLDGAGSVSLHAEYNVPYTTYGASLVVDSLDVSHFLPHDSIYTLSAEVTASGKGLDWYAPSTAITVSGAVKSLLYGKRNIKGIDVHAGLDKNRYTVGVNSTFPPAQFTTQLDGSITKEEVDGKLTIHAKHIDLYRLGVVDIPFSTQFDVAATARSRWNEVFDVALNLSEWEITDKNKLSILKPLRLKGMGRADSLHLNLSSGDLHLSLAGGSSITLLQQQLNNFTGRLAREMKEKKKILSLYEMRPLLPSLSVALTVGKDNPLAYIMGQNNLSFSSMEVVGQTSPTAGIHADAHLYNLKVDTLLLDTVAFTLRQDSNALLLNGGVHNGAMNKQHVFTADVAGSIGLDHANALLSFKDALGKTGLNVGISAAMEGDGLRLHLYPEDPILAFKQFTVNPNNYIYIGKGFKDIRADLSLQGEGGSAVTLYSAVDTIQSAEQVTLGLKHFNIGQTLALFPYLPQVGGMLHAEVSYGMEDSLYHIAAQVGVDSLSYENKPMGSLALKGSYLPDADKNHHLDAHLFHNDKEVLTAKGDYYVIATGDSVYSNLTIQDFPLDIANAFIPEEMANIQGKLQGKLRFEGSQTDLKTNGFMRFDSTAIEVLAAGATLRMEEKDITIQNNRLQFDDVNIYSSGKNPFVIDGYIDASKPAEAYADLRFTTQKMELLNAKQNKQSLVYGKVFINLNTTIKGPLESLLMRGNLELLGGTDVTYILKDSPLAVQDRLSGLVTFVNFSDTAAVVKDETVPLQLGGMDVLLTIDIDQSVRANVDLAEDQSSRIELEGGGNLSFQYTPLGEMVLNGRYTLNGGNIKYALPVVGAKDFSIRNGSYVQWLGNAFDPQLNITAFERVRTSVILNNQPAQMVNFDASIAIKNTLEDLSLVFDLEAPENLTVQNQLAATSPEERSKQAITMLVTGTYVAEGASTKGGLDMGSTLNSFLQNEINNLTGSALKGVDLTFGMENSDPNGPSGMGEGMDYSFRFSKRFYNDRIRVIVGGKISTGAADEGDNQSFLDNVTVEYRLDDSGTRYVQLFHDSNYESILEGEVTETGVGIVLRKKMRRMKELFIFRNRKQQTKTQKR